jgi:hypothetical protein
MFSQKNGKPLVDNRLRRFANSLGVTTDNHGFRGSLKCWALEKDGYPVGLMNRCLGYRNAENESNTDRAYGRTDMLDQRRPVMDAWAKFLKA